MSMEYIRKIYGVPAKRGGKVMIVSSRDGDISFEGTIVASKRNYLRIRLLNGHIGTYHPTDHIEYL